MRKIGSFLVFVIVVFFAQKAEAQSQFQGVQYLPHIVAGSLPVSEWDTVIELKCLSSKSCPTTIEFFNSIGENLILDTDNGMSNRFDVVVPPAIPGPGSFSIYVSRNQQFVSGWARVTSSSTFSGIGKFRQFTPGGVEPVGIASVFFSASDMVLTFDLKPSNGVALVNPSTTDATVTATALFGGREIKEVFQLPKGHHRASFFRDPPFSFGELTGNVVIASNVPIVGLELGFEGLEFFTLPSLPTIRRIDARRANIKIGAIYVFSDDRSPKQNIAQQFSDGFGKFELLLRRELALHGTMQNIPELPVDRDENKLPKVLLLKLQKPRAQYFKAGGGVDTWAIQSEIIPEVPEDWRFQMIYVDIFEHYPDGRVKGGIALGYGGGFGGIAFISALDSDSALQTFSHEFGHAMGALFHVGPDPLLDDAKPWRTIMGGVGDGCYNLSADTQCILSPMEAQAFARMPILNLHKYGWIQEDREKPTVSILFKERIGNKIKLALRMEDIGSGVHSVWVERNLFPGTNFWRLLSHSDDLDSFELEAIVPSDPDPFIKTNVGVMDYHGNISYVQIF